MKSYKEFFKGKKVTMLGLGLLGRGLNDAKFLAECGAELLITDLKSREQLAPTLKKLAKYKNIKYILGEHRLEDFGNRDFILKSAGVPLDSHFVAEAKKNNIPIEMDESLFAKLAPNVKIIGITGTRGKTTTTFLIYEILKSAFSEKVHLGGNIKGLATLPLLKKVKEGNIVVMELSSWQLQGFGDAKISPAISVFTNLMNDHLNYYKGNVEEYFLDKAKIYKNQKESDFLICGEKIFNKIGKVNGNKIVANKTNVSKDWELKLKGEHNLENIACAVKVAEIFGVEKEIIKKAVCNFGGVEDRQEFLREYKGIKIYNDTTATTPDATVVALKALGSKKKNVVLIMGGADKNLDMSELIKEVPKHCKKVILLTGTGTEKLDGKIDGILAKSLREGLLEALKWAKKGDVLVLSPAFASFGMFKNEFDRGDQFKRFVKVLK